MIMMLEIEVEIEIEIEVDYRYIDMLVGGLSVLMMFVKVL